MYLFVRFFFFLKNDSLIWYQIWPNYTTFDFFNGLGYACGPHLLHQALFNPNSIGMLNASYYFKRRGKKESKVCLGTNYVISMITTNRSIYLVWKIVFYFSIFTLITNMWLFSVVFFIICGWKSFYASLKYLQYNVNIFWIYFTLFHNEYILPRALVQEQLFRNTVLIWCQIQFPVIVKI